MSLFTSGFAHVCHIRAHLKQKSPTRGIWTYFSRVFDQMSSMCSVNPPKRLRVKMKQRLLVFTKRYVRETPNGQLRCISWVSIIRKSNLERSKACFCLRPIHDVFSTWIRRSKRYALSRTIPTITEHFCSAKALFTTKHLTKFLQSRQAVNRRLHPAKISRKTLPSNKSQLDVWMVIVKSTEETQGSRRSRETGVGGSALKPHDKKALLLGKNSWFFPQPSDLHRTVWSVYLDTYRHYANLGDFLSLPTWILPYDDFGYVPLGWREPFPCPPK